MSSSERLEAEGAAPALVTGHPFTPRGEWWTTCGHVVARWMDAGLVHSRPQFCGLAEAAHAETTLRHAPKTVIEHERTP